MFGHSAGVRSGFLAGMAETDWRLKAARRNAVAWRKCMLAAVVALMVLMVVGELLCGYEDNIKRVSQEGKLLRIIDYCSFLGRGRSVSY